MSSQLCHGGTETRVQAVEVSTFLFLIVPPMVLGYFVVEQQTLHFATAAIGSMLGDLSLVALILYFLWRNGEPRSLIGWTARRWPREILLGVLIFIPTFFCASAVETIAKKMGLSAPTRSIPSFLKARGAVGYALASVLVVIVAVSEETIFRGYLIRRFRTLTGGNLWAVILATAIFSLGHTYEGSAGVVTVFFLGVVFALVFLWRKSLLAPMTMHFLQDFLGLVVLPLRARK